MKNYDWMPKREELVVYAANIVASAAMYSAIHVGMNSLEKRFQLDYNVPSIEQNIAETIYASIESTKENMKKEDDFENKIPNLENKLNNYQIENTK